MTLRANHSTLDSFQRIMLANPRTSFRSNVADMPLASKSPRSLPRRHTQRPAKLEIASPDRRSTNHFPAPVGMGEDIQIPHEARESSVPESRSANVTRESERRRRPETQDSNASAMTLGTVEEAGFSELQAAFESAYERMLRVPPPSVVDTVLSAAWQPKVFKSAESRARFQMKQLRCPLSFSRIILFQHRITPFANAGILALSSAGTVDGTPGFQRTRSGRPTTPWCMFARARTPACKVCVHASLRPWVCARSP